MCCSPWGHEESDTTLQLNNETFFFFEIVFSYLCLVELGLHCYSRALSSCSEQGFCSCWDVGASHCTGFTCYRACALGQEASVLLAPGFYSAGSELVPCRLSCSWRVESFQTGDLTCVLCIGRWTHKPLFPGSPVFSIFWKISITVSDDSCNI